MIFAMSANVASPQSRRPGDEAYRPTKLEWAALELQAAHGRTAMTRDSPLSISFIPQPDGVTVLCLLQYTTDYQAAALKIERDSLEYAFQKYRLSRGWPWLMLKFEDRVIPQQWPR
jgi:hypothetical protein